MEGLLWKLIWKRMVQLGKTHNFQIYFESNFVEMFCSIYTPPPPFLRCINEMLCVYVVLLIKLIQFCYFCAKRKCFFIIKLNTYIECKHSMKRGVWKSIWNECNVYESVKKSEQKCQRKDGIINVREYRSIYCWLNIFTMGHHREACVLTTPRSSFSFYIAFLCVCIICGAVTLLCLNQFSFNKKNISIISGNNVYHSTK